MFFKKRFLTVFKTRNMRNINTFAFFDSETTGLPHLENCLGVFPRVQNKLALCFNPGRYISKEVSDITGLDNFLLENQSPFSSSTVKTIRQFLEAQEKPVCLVAHNGNRFDYPILRTEIHRTGESLPDDILCIDSLQAFRHLHSCALEEPDTLQVTQVVSSESLSISLPPEFEDGYDELLCSLADETEEGTRSGKKTVEEIRKMNETTPQKKISVRRDLFPGIASSSSQSTSGTVARKLNFGTPSFKLGDIYKRLTKKEASESHKAEGDVNMLITCAAFYGRAFISWANENAKAFNDVPLMQIGRKIGT